MWTFLEETAIFVNVFYKYILAQPALHDIHNLIIAQNKNKFNTRFKALNRVFKVSG